jgi:hypothetical protein
MQNSFLSSSFAVRSDLLTKSRQTSFARKGQALLKAPSLNQWNTLRPLYLKSFQCFGAGMVNNGSLAEEPLEPGTFQKVFYIREEPHLLTPKGQILKLSDSLKEAMSDTDKPMPERVRLRLVYEQQPPIAGIRKFLEDMAKQAQGNSARMIGARLFMGMPRQLPEMALQQSPRNDREIIFVVETKNRSRDELLKFARFLVKGSPFLPEKYE